MMGAPVSPAAAPEHNHRRSEAAGVYAPAFCYFRRELAGSLCRKQILPREDRYAPRRLVDGFRNRCDAYGDAGSIERGSGARSLGG